MVVRVGDRTGSALLFNLLRHPTLTRGRLASKHPSCELVAFFSPCLARGRPLTPPPGRPVVQRARGAGLARLRHRARPFLHRPRPRALPARAKPFFRRGLSPASRCGRGAACARCAQGAGGPNERHRAADQAVSRPASRPRSNCFTAHVCLTHKAARVLRSLPSFPAPSPLFSGCLP